jgi:hypothetical protein
MLRRSGFQPRANCGTESLFILPIRCDTCGRQGLFVKKHQTTSKLVRSAVAMALCYVVVVQAFLAGCSIGLAVSQASTTTVICHGGGGNSPAGPDNRTPASDSCLVCAICTLATAGGLAAPTTATVAAPRTASHRVAPFDITALATAPPARAGFARAPPKFA